MKLPKFKIDKKNPKTYFLGLAIVLTVLLGILLLIWPPTDSFDLNIWRAVLNQIAFFRWVSFGIFLLLVFWSLRWWFKLSIVALILLVSIALLLINPYLLLMVIEPYESIIETLSAWPTVVERLPSPDHKKEAIISRVYDLSIPENSDLHFYVISVQSPKGSPHVVYQSHFETEGTEYDKLHPCTFLPKINWVDNQTIDITQKGTELYQYVPGHVPGAFTFPIGGDECKMGKRLLKTTFSIYEPTQTFCCLTHLTKNW